MDRLVEAAGALAIVQARGGSKSIPRKNLKLLGGHPLIAYSIAAGLQARHVSRVIMSTDDEEIAEVARAYGAETPFMRPRDISKDQSIDLDLFQHALKWLYENEGYKPEIVVQLRPTTPFRPRDCVDSAVEILLEHPDADSVRGLVPSGQNPYKMWRIDESGLMQPLLDSEFEEPFNMPRQDLPATHWQTGHIDALRYATIMEMNSMSGKTIYPILLDPDYTVDIDTEAQLEWAEYYLRVSDLDIVRPDIRPTEANKQPVDASGFPNDVQLLVLDFDGVMTDNRVYVLEDGREAVVCDRGDGMGISLIKRQGVEVVVLSTETNPVVSARCKKLNIEHQHGLSDKAMALRKLVADKGIEMSNVVFAGNDVNDLGCMREAGFAVAVSDAHYQAKSAADLILTRPGGHGAVRELCDMIINRGVQRSKR